MVLDPNPGRAKHCTVKHPYASFNTPDLTHPQITKGEFSIKAKAKHKSLQSWGPLGPEFDTKIILLLVTNTRTRQKEQFSSFHEVNN